MILFYRVIPFAIALVSGLGFFALLRLPAVHPGISIAVSGSLLFALQARLATWKPSTFRFWVFVGTPFLLFASACGAMLFFEPGFARPLSAVLVTAFVALFSEHVFTYVHLPAKYQAYALEHLSLGMNVFTMFFVSVVGFASRMFLGLPLLAVSLGFFAAALFVIYETLWVSKVEGRPAAAYAFAGTVLSAEIFTVATFLPAGYFTLGALMAVAFYLFLGITRAHFTGKLTRSVLRRYLLVSILLIVLVLATARWI